MHHTIPLAVLALSLSAILMTFVFPETITAYNSTSATFSTDSEPEAVAQPITTSLDTQTSEQSTELRTEEVPLVETPAVEQDGRALGTIEKSNENESESIRLVPFFSQFADITDPAWKKVSCGVASLAMLVNYYKTEATDANELLVAGIAADAYTENGWSHAGLIGLAKQFGLTGASRSLADQSASEAFTTLRTVVTEGPVMASVHYTFEPTNPIPHLVVITHIADGYVYYNDPAEARGNGFITIEKFKKSWKQRYIEIRPAV